MDYKKKNEYGKKSIWKWIIIYLILAIVLYAGIFLAYREIKDKGTDDSGTTTTSQSLY